MSTISRADLIDVPERRAVAQAFEVRSTGNNIVKITGYASVFNRGYDVHGGATAGGWTEVVTPGAFKRTLAENPHVHLLINHEGLPLASTKSKTLRLSTDSTGLISEAEVDRRNTRANDMILTLERGDADEMSFAFRVKGQSWSDDECTRSLDEVSLHKGDVSVVSFGANPFTSVSVRNAVRALCRPDVGPRQLAELRSMAADVDRAMAVLNRSRGKKSSVLAARGDDDGDPADPRKLVSGLDAILDEAYNLVYDVDRAGLPDNVGQALDLINAAQVSMDELMKAMGMYDPNIGERSLRQRRSRSLNANVPILGSKIDFARKVHDIAVSSGANCDPAGGADQDPALTPLRSMSPTLDYPPGLEDGDVFDDDSRQRDSLAQAVHDLIVDTESSVCENGDGTECDDDADEPDYDDNSQPYNAPLRNLTVGDATRATYSDGNLTLSAAMRQLRPEDSPEPLSIEDATRIAS